MTRLRVTRYGPDRLRVGPWRGHRDAALVTPVAGWPVPTTDGVRACLSDLRDLGYASFVTSALTIDECGPFVDAGFSVRERLALLGRDLTELPEAQRERADRPTPARTKSARGSAEPGGARLRRARRRDRSSVLAVDRLAFDPFWRLDEEGLHEALTATPTRRFRVAIDGGVVGYAITGRNRDRAYLQRLAVHPRAQRRHVGTGLIIDALRWARAHRAESILVNTQAENDGALALYERLGFARRPDGLTVMTLSHRIAS